MVDRPRPGKPQLTDERVRELVREAANLVHPYLNNLGTNGIVTVGRLTAAMRRKDAIAELRRMALYDGFKIGR